MSLKNHIKKKIRWEKDDLILYNPTKEEYQQLLEELETKQVQFDNDMMNLEVGVELIRKCFERFTNVGEEVTSMSDDELMDCIDDGDIIVSELYVEITKLIQEIMKMMVLGIETQINDLKNLNELYKNVSEGDAILENLIGMLKEQGLDMTTEELLEMLADKNILDDIKEEK